MRRITADQAILALIYSDSAMAAQSLRRAGELLLSAGLTCAGYVELEGPLRPGRTRCDMVIKSLATGEELTLSEDRGPLARGCRLDTAMLACAIEKAQAALRSGPHILIINKFGKTEAEGGGFRPLLADAMAAAIPVVVAVPRRNIDSWRKFAGDFAREVSVDRLQVAGDHDLLGHLGLAIAKQTAVECTGQRLPSRR